MLTPVHDHYLPGARGDAAHRTHVRLHREVLGEVVLPVVRLELGGQLVPQQVLLVGTHQDLVVSEGCHWLASRNIFFQ